MQGPEMNSDKLPKSELMRESPLILIASKDISGMRETAGELRNSGYRVLTTPSSHRAIQMAECKAPDLLILDFELNGLDGIETCRMMKEHLGMGFPVIFLSEETSEERVLQAYSAGVSDVLPRPAPAGMLKAKIKILLQEKQAQSEPVSNFQGPGSNLSIPGYKIEKMIGKGSTGTVYLANQSESTDYVAIKVLNIKTVHNIRNIKRFYRGSLIGLELPSHPNIVQVHEIKRAADHIYQVMEYVPGSTLEQIMKTGHILSEQEALQILDSIGLALEHLHEHNVIHRDVKPGNIFVMDNWRAKLGDMGISRRLIDRIATSTGHVVGTPGYISPEQVLNRKEVDIRADLYSLGLTMFHAVTGENPYFRDTAYSSMIARIEEPDAKLTSEEAPHLSIGFCSIISRLIRRNKAQRYSDPAAMLRAISTLKAIS